MKIKNAFPTLKAGMLAVIFTASLVVCTVLRTYQMFTSIEPGTGFNVGPQWLMILLYVVLFGSCLALCVISYLSKETAELQPMGIKSLRAAVVTFLLAFRFLGDWILNVFGGASSLSGTEVGFKGLMASGILTGTLQGVFAFISMIYMVILAFDFKSGTTHASKFKILALAPAGWACARLVENFLSQISFLEISDLFLDLVMLSFMAMFFMSLAQINSGVGSTGLSWRLSGYGYPAALVTLTVFLSRTAVSLVKGSEALNPSHLANITDGIFALFAVVVIIETIKNNRIDEEV